MSKPTREERLEELLMGALVYVEDALASPDFKKGVVLEDVNKIRAELGLERRKS